MSATIGSWIRSNTISFAIMKIMANHNDLWMIIDKYNFYTAL